MCKVGYNILFCELGQHEVGEPTLKHLYPCAEAEAVGFGECGNVTESKPGHFFTKCEACKVNLSLERALARAALRAGSRIVSRAVSRLATGSNTPRSPKVPDTPKTPKTPKTPRTPRTPKTFTGPNTPAPKAATPVIEVKEPVALPKDDDAQSTY
ncbi:hypothetical protein F5B19DRAFT_449072 [Rostrohypoxylon terebratum]|nr:hypothetical protein F5B19DRAFT_449072 [Rostrohypoxylon terebratum]